MRDGATWQESFSDEEERIVLCQPRPIRLLFKIAVCEIVILVHHAEYLEDVLMRLPIGPSLVRGMTWVSMSSGDSIIEGDSSYEDAWLFDSDTIVAWPSEVWAREQEARKQSREDEEEDELLRQTHLPGDTSGVLEQGDVDGTGVADVGGREHLLDPSTPSVYGLGSNPISHTPQYPMQRWAMSSPVAL